MCLSVTYISWGLYILGAQSYRSVKGTNNLDKIIILVSLSISNDWCLCSRASAVGDEHRWLELHVR